jgi:hypothetical protein
MDTTITFARPAPLLSLNDRHHWAHRSRVNKLWRTAAHTAACTIGPPSARRANGRVLIAVTLPVRSVKVRRDPHNFVATIKPIIDGLVDAGVVPDDDSRWVVTAEPAFAAGSTVTVRISDGGVDQ